MPTLPTNAALWSLLGLALLLLVGLLSRIPLRLQVDFLAHDAPKMDIDLRASLSLAGLALRVLRPYGAGRLLHWQLLFLKKLIVEGERRLTSTRIDDETSAKPERPPRAGRVEIDWGEVLAWFLEQRRHLLVDELYIKMRVGLEDPAHTGTLYGLAQSLLAANLSAIDVDIVPVFDRSTLDGQARLRLRLHPLPLLGATAWFALTRVRFRIFLPLARPRKRVA